MVLRLCLRTLKVFIFNIILKNITLFKIIKINKIQVFYFIYFLFVYLYIKRHMDCSNLKYKESDIPSLITSHYGVPPEFIKQGTALRYGKNTTNNELRKDSYIGNRLVGKTGALKVVGIENAFRDKSIRDKKSCFQEPELSKPRMFFENVMRSNTEADYSVFKVFGGEVTRNNSSYSK